MFLQLDENQSITRIAIVSVVIANFIAIGSHVYAYSNIVAGMVIGHGGVGLAVIFEGHAIAGDTGIVVSVVVAIMVVAILITFVDITVAAITVVAIIFIAIIFIAIILITISILIIVHHAAT